MYSQLQYNLSSKRGVYVITTNNLLQNPIDVNAIVFDLGSTLVKHVPGEYIASWEAVRTILTENSPSLEQVHKLWIPTWHATRGQGKRLHERNRLYFQLLLAKLGYDVELSHPDIERALSIYYDKIVSLTTIYPDVKPVLMELIKRQFQLAVLTNASKQWAKPVLEKQGIKKLITNAVISDLLPWEKPHPEIFTYTCKLIDSEPRNTLYVGDSIYHDIYGGFTAGMRTCLIQRGGETANIGHVMPDVTADLTICSLDELPPLLFHLNYESNIRKK